MALTKRLLFLIIWIVHFECSEVYPNRPKITATNGDLIFEAAPNKNIILRTNGPDSKIFVGDTNLLNITRTSGSDQHAQTSVSGLQRALNGPNGILARLRRLERRNIEPSSNILFNITVLWRKVNRQATKISDLRKQINEMAQNKCASRPCYNGGTCLNLASGYYCICPDNWEGQNCDEDVNECRNFAGTDLGCQNGATCLNKPGSYECQCINGWRGVHCSSKSKNCIGGNYEMCGHGTCINTASGEGITCICDQGWTKNGSTEACLTDIDECTASQGLRCSGNPRVECVNLPGSFRCGPCPAGYEGDGFVCSDIDECLTTPNGGCSISPMVTCHNTIGSRMCGPCPTGYEGDGVTCTFRGSCNINRGGCHPSAQCVDSPGFGGQLAQCICPPGMEGDGIGLHGCYISTNNNTAGCDTNPCGINGRCHPLRSGYTCMCYRGYGGAHCDAVSDNCASNPCLNGGTCRTDVSTLRKFRCECTAQYSGDLCQVAVTTCGGVKAEDAGSIIYPLNNYTKYNNNARCAWVIRIDPDKVINVTFSKFNLERSPDCKYDFLQIHDGPNSASQFIGRFCGNVLPQDGNIISSHNTLYLWFRTDQSIAKDGFALHWTSIAPVCGGEIDATVHGSINSPGSPGNYPPNRDCYWHLTAALGKRLQLHFFSLDIESHANCSFDYVSVYDGAQTADSLLGMYCTSALPVPIHSAGPEVMIHFHSDDKGSGKGFQIAYSPIEGIPGCGGLYTTDHGEIMSPSYQGRYLNNLLCEYKIQATLDSKIHLKFESFDLESSIGCKFDYLKVYDGPSSNSKLFGTFCGRIRPNSITSTSKTLFIRFKSDISMSKTGFKLSYNFICYQTIIGDSGVIKSPGYPVTYPESRVCEYIIGTTPGKAIQLTFQDFDVEDTTFYNCTADYVQIHDGLDGNATFLGKYCGGDRIPPDQLSSSNYMYIKFVSDFSVTGTGFYANYTTINVECGGVYRESTGVINHPLEDGFYKNDQSCTWILIAPVGMHIMLTWNRFDLEHMSTCNMDYLEVIEVDSDNNNYTLGKYCGSTAPPLMTVPSSKVILEFRSDNSLRSTGFSMSYKFLNEKSHCGATYMRPYGVLYSPGYPNRYEPNVQCEWVIIAPYGRQIKLNITNFGLERPIYGKCDYGDYVEIRNGKSRNGSLAGKYCGTFNSKVLTSTANSMYIRFYSDAYVSGTGFKIEWDSTVSGCGGILTSPSGSISSPNYPEKYNENAECFYKITTNAGTRIRIHFKEIDLERRPNCNDDYVEVYDGRNENNNRLGRFCESSPEANNMETTTNNAFIKFRSDYYIGGKGFLLEYETICTTNLTGIHGAIESPGYPNVYPSSLNCLWTINIPNGNKINITFVHFDLTAPAPSRSRHYFSRPRHYYVSSLKFRQSPSTCNYDYLQIKETTDVNYGNKLCGYSLVNTKSASYSSRTNSIQIKFVTASLVSHTGFRLEWVQYGCGGLIKKDYGQLSVDKSVITNGKLECQWVIETSPGSSISVQTSNIYMQEAVNCSVDAIEIYNGPDMSTPLITKICHQGYSSAQSTTNYMLVRFIKKSSMKDVSVSLYYNSYATGCGGSITSRTGIVHSKNFPKNYDNNLDCMWTISVASHHRVELQFTELDLYSDSPDDDNCGDKIEIFDGEYYLKSNYSQLICPNTNVSQIISKSNMLGLQFITDSEDTAKGFKANFTVTCGGIIDAKYDGIITNDKTFSSYDNNCTWTIIASSPDQKISLTITHMSISTKSNITSNKKCPSSFLKVYDGNDKSAPLIDEYCGRKVPPMIVSHGSAITIELGAYNNIVQGTFAAHYSTMTTACGGTLTAEEGSLASPNYPQSYPIRADCEWFLSTSPGNKVYITFEKFDIEPSDDCNGDYLEIREDNGGGRLLALYCGSAIPINTTVSSKLYLKFHSDNTSPRQGFLLHYGFIHGNEIIGKDSGEIASPVYPFKYEGAGEYAWRVEVKQGTIIAISISELEIPTFGDSCSNSLVLYDGYDVDAPILQEFCGRMMNYFDESQITRYKTTSNVVFITLKLDDTNTGSMFHLRWANSEKNIETESKPNCGFNETQTVIPGQTVTFNSPNYPNEYQNNLKCEWVFKAVKGRHLVLHFKEYSIEETPACFADAIAIYSADVLGDWKLIKENICLADDLSKQYNITSYMKIIFKTDVSITRKGFKAEVGSQCGGVLTESSGVVEPIWSDIGESSSRIQCYWKVKVRPGRVVRFNFEHFNITNTQEDCSTFISIRNGDSLEAPLLTGAKFCGYSYENRSTAESSSNAIFVSYSAYIGVRGRPFQNFRLRYEEKHFECGVTSTLDSDHQWEIINSPNYPAVPASYSDCVWIFTGPPGEILRIDFTDRFDLELSEDCSKEAVEVKDGASNLSPSKGRYCGKEKPSTIKTTGNIAYIQYMTGLLEPKNGFQANVSIDVCGGTIVASKGELLSPGYPHLQAMPIGTICEWRIIGPPRNVLKIALQDLRLPDSEESCGIYVSIEEPLIAKTSNQLVKYCGDEIITVNSNDHVTETSSNEAIVKFKIGKLSGWSGFIGMRGFRFTFNSSRPSCGGLITTSEGYLSTPAYPRETTHRYCRWLITVPDKTRRVRLEILDYDLEQHKIGIYNDINFNTIIQLLSKPNETVRFFESTGNQLAVYVWMNALASRHRFNAKFTSDDESLCGGDLSIDRQTLAAPALSRAYLCTWNYNYRPDVLNNKSSEYKSIYINAKVNSSSSTALCSYNVAKLTIKTVLPRSLGPMLRKICGNGEISLRIPAIAFEVQAIKSKSDFMDFNLEWKLQPCGGIIHLTLNAMDLLNGLTNENDTIDCAWMVVAPSESRVEIKLEGEFQLDCVDEFVQISEGLNQYSSMLGDYCKERGQANAVVKPYIFLLVQYHSKYKSDTKLKIMVKATNGQCGGLLTYNRIFQSPNYPKAYAPNLECSWEIQVGLGNRIQLQFFDRFVIEKSDNCTKDALILYDWKDGAYVETKKLCGRDLPGTLNSTTNQMKVVLHTDDKINLEGFRAVWNSVCGGNFTATDKVQYIQSPGYPDLYPSFSDCTYIISSDYKVNIKFEHFELEGEYPTCNFDNVTLEQTYKYDYSQNVYCGREIPPPLHKYNKVKIVFKSDSNIESKGFRIAYNTHQCGGTIKEPTVISSGQTSYDDDLNCTWVIEAPSDKIVVLKFQYVDLEGNQLCNTDYISVFDGTELNANNRLALICGNINTTTAVRSRSNKMLLQFVTDYSLSYTGFKADVAFTYSSPVGCGGAIGITSTSSYTLKSPLLNGKVVYENFLDCHWEITASADQVIQMEFTEFHVSSCAGINQTALGFSKCYCDYVEIKDGFNPDDLTIGKYCGHNFPPQLVSSSNRVSFRLVTDGDLGSSGFSARLSTKPSPCGKSTYVPSLAVQRITSPGYSTGAVPRGVHCVYYIDMASYPYTELRMTIKNLDIRYGEPDKAQCNKDSVSINRAFNTGKNQTIGKDYIMNGDRSDMYQYYNLNVERLIVPNRYVLCGKSQPFDYYLYNSMTVDFQTTAESDSNTYKGLEIEFALSVACSRNYTETNGRIKSKYYSAISQEAVSKDCYTLITVPDKYTISLYFISLAPDYWDQNIYLDVYDGNSTSATRMLHAITQTTGPPALFSSGRYVLLHHHNEQYDRITYDLVYTSTDAGRGCGGRFAMVRGVVSSPLYPSLYRQKSSCEWVIETPAETRVFLHFQAFDMGLACDQNSLRLVDRSGAVVASHCAEFPADYTAQDNYLKLVFVTTMNNGGTGWLADFVAVV